MQPDGTPAENARFIQNHQAGHGNHSAEMMMGSGGMEDEMGMGMEMDMGMGSNGGASESMFGISASNAIVTPEINFLDGRLLQGLSGAQGHEERSDSSGKIKALRSLDSWGRHHLRHRYSSLAIHPSGISFIPAGTQLKKTLQLRQGGSILVVPPKGFEADKFVVLTCWQNGFAWPSKTPFAPNLKFQFPNSGTSSDWRFTPQFRLFQLGKLGVPLPCPPGEVRVTLLPVRSSGKPYNQMNGEELLDQLISGGPSRIAVVSGQSTDTRQVDFGPLLRLEVSLAERSDSQLPQWGDAPQLRYTLMQLDAIRRSPPAHGALQSLPRIFTSPSAFADFLNQERSSRSVYQLSRTALTSSPDQLIFPMINEGKYVLGRNSDNDVATSWIPLTMTSKSSDRVVAEAGEGKPTNDPNPFAINITRAAKRTPQGISDAARLASARSDAEKLKLVEELRSELEQTVRRLVEYRGRLLKIESAIHSRRASRASVDPFDDASSQQNPFGMDQPFDDIDPFGDGRAAEGDDPFGGSDPFGSDIFETSGQPDPTDPATQDPFGPSPSSKNESNSNSPFDDPAMQDPFG